MPQKILGIDQGSYSIKVAEIERQLGAFQLVGFFEQPVVYSESVSKEASQAQALQRLFEEYNLMADQIYSAIPGQLTSHREIDLPFSDFKKVDQTIEFEMENYLPLPLEEMLIDYQFLHTSKTDAQVLVSYARKSDFITLLNMMSNTNADPRFMGSEPVELANIMKLGVLQPEGAYALVDLGHEKTNVVIFHSAKLQFVRTIMVGGKDLTQSIADALNIPFLEAERMKVEMGQIGPELEGADTTTRNISEAIKKPLADLLLQLKQTFMAFQQTRSEAVQALILCGGTSRLPGIDHYLSSELRKNVSFLDCLDFSFNQLSDSQWCRPIAASALSLAYRGVIGSGVRNIQFRRGEFAHQGEIRDLMSMVKQVGILLGIIFTFSVGSFGLSYISLKGRAKSQLAQITTMAAEALPEVPKKIISTPNSILSTLTAKINEAEEKKKKIDEETSLSVLSVLKDFSNALPTRDTVQVEIDDMTIAARRIRLQGKTTSFEAIDQIKMALSKSKSFKNVSTENVKKGAKDEIKFNLSIEVGDVTGHEGSEGT